MSNFGNRTYVKFPEATAKKQQLAVTGLRLRLISYCTRTRTSSVLTTWKQWFCKCHVGIPLPVSCLLYQSVEFILKSPSHSRHSTHRCHFRLDLGQVSSSFGVHALLPEGDGNPTGGLSITPFPKELGGGNWTIEEASVTALVCWVPILLLVNGLLGVAGPDIESSLEVGALIENIPARCQAVIDVEELFTQYLKKAKKYILIFGRYKTPCTAPVSLKLHFLKGKVLTLNAPLPRQAYKMCPTRILHCYILRHGFPIMLVAVMLVAAARHSTF